MHRAIESTVPPASTDALVRKLEKSDDLISLAVHRGASITPPGDVVVMHALNGDADRILKLADAAREQGSASETTHDLSSIVDPEHERVVANDVDEALWEEAETVLRHQSQVTANYANLDGPGRRDRGYRARRGVIDRPGDFIHSGGDYCTRFRAARQHPVGSALCAVLAWW